MKLSTRTGGVALQWTALIIALCVCVRAVDATKLTIQGRLLCGSRPIPQTRVTMLNSNGGCMRGLTSFADTFMGMGHSDQDGYFHVTGSGSDPPWILLQSRFPDPYIRVDYYHKSEKAELEIVPAPFSLDLEIEGNIRGTPQRDDAMHALESLYGFDARDTVAVDTNFTKDTSINQQTWTLVTW